ncbi:ABC transporter permease [Rodentibacter trehalosifermentans]|uniref:ABC transporter permease n=1 Tax=Rodentibacter trehalosifermentans TaxID=1908263 RepID=A0A1V3IYP4_9PAST|nr:ABC transporter permease [Rodentibacter trehalosifermentans]OOF43855.1 ABC transporter permease [Rodentibacter trehalosifermentans]OOF47143.1 ABC transporter permease [Rodentibacter trehalosifermentans]OOF49084.1 ABC transporter permease [Rodentibacter trehalosifermentans]
MIRLFKPVLICLVMLLLWQLIILVGSFPHYILPTPQAVWKQLISHPDLLWQHSRITLLEIGLGLFFGFLFGLFSALLLSFSKKISALLLPILVISQAIPVFAIAPLLVLWFGYGMASKIVMSILIIYFPVTAACFDGLRNTPQAWLDLANTFKISPFRLLLKVRLPAALPAFASGLRIAISVAPIGAVVGEWVGSSEGLGYLMIHANARMQVDLMFAALLILIAISLCLYFGMDWLLRRFIPWGNRVYSS